MHTSGRHGLAVLEPARAVGARTIAMHPAMTFTGTEVDLPRLAGCVFGVTADEADRELTEALVADLGGRPMWVPEDRRTLYHAGLAHGANHLVTLITEAMEILSAAGADDPAATLRPLLTAALDNALEHGDAALTGPIVRGDVETVRAHVADLVANAPQTLPSYVTMARATLDRAVTDGRLLPIRAAKMLRVLDAAEAAASRPLERHHVDDLHARPRAHPRGARRPARRRPPGAASRIAFVPTMGALHEGHASLMRTAREATTGPVVVSIFVNPMQFAPTEDLDRYPRTLDADLEVCAAEGVDVVFAPSVEEMYPGGFSHDSVHDGVTVAPGALATILDGESRPGHFDGVLTVVAKLFGLVRPDVAVFGQKDYQQLTLIRRMVRDLCMGIEVVGAETVREADGLALSSRNRYLDAEQRRAAVALSRALRAAQERAPYGVPAARWAAMAVLKDEPGLELDYLALTSPDLGEAPETGEGRILVAARVGHHAPDRQHAHRLRTIGSTTAGTALAASTTSEEEQLMLRTMMKSKIHRATVTQADLHYVGSVTVDEDLLDAADLLAGELVHIVDVTNGARLETYTIAGERGSGVIGINGAAARLVHPGDTVILIGYAQMETAEARELKPHVVFVDADNKVMATGFDPAETFGDKALTRGDFIDR